VEEGLALTYDDVVDTGSSDISYVLRDLTNGVRYYLAMKAVFVDEEKSPAFSSEIVVTPSSVYPDAPGSSDPEYGAGGEEDTEAPVVEAALALTQTLVKVSFSEDVLLPSVLPELSFTVTESLNSSVFLPVEIVEYKVDYKGEAEKEDIHENIVFITLSESFDPDTEYLVTVSAAVADLAGNPINSGVTDSATFMGTSATEIPAEEQPLLSVPEEPENVPEPDPVVADTTPPEDVTDFAITSVPRVNDFLLNMRWKKSNADDVSHQAMYRSEDDGVSWQNEATLDKDTEDHDSSGQPETELAFKLTATDIAGNENAGVIESVRLPPLPATGAPLALLALGATLSFFGIRRFKKK